MITFETKQNIHKSLCVEDVSKAMKNGNLSLPNWRYIRAHKHEQIK